MTAILARLFFLTQEKARLFFPTLQWYRYWEKVEPDFFLNVEARLFFFENVKGRKFIYQKTLPPPPPPDY